MITSVTVDGAPLPWHSVSVSRSLEGPVSAARIATWSPPPTRAAVACAVDWSGLPILRGVVESWPGSARRGFDVTARSLTLALQKTEAAANEFHRDTTAGRIAGALCGRVSVEFAGVDADEPVDRLKVERGDSYQGALQDLCASKGYVLTDDADGRAVLYRAPVARQPVEIWQLGAQPVRDISISPSLRDWYDSIWCRGQRSPTPSDIEDPALALLAAQLVAGSTYPSRRVLEPRAARSVAAARRLVADEARKALAASYSVSVELDETAVQPGQIVRILSEPDDLDDSLIVSEMTWRASASDVGVAAVLVPIAAYDFSGSVSADPWRGRA